MYYKYPVSDVHIHAFDKAFAMETLHMVQELGYEKFVMLSGNSIFNGIMGNNLLCAWIKLKSNGRGYAFAAAHYPEAGLPCAGDMLAQVTLYHKLGFDGIKMMDGKPNMRKRIGAPLNDPAYDPMFRFMESMDMPLLYHVNDPWEFWQWDQMPQWAQKMGKEVYYGDGAFPSKGQIEEEAVDILRKHPKLRVIFPHFFFTANDLPRTRELFQTYPNLWYDITPGWEMFESFAQDYDAWRQFFIEYSQRILFGTDTISDHWRETVSSLRRVMETDEEFVAFEEHCHGLKLEGKPLQNIYKHNFDRYLPQSLRPMDVPGLMAYGQSLYPKAKALAGDTGEQAAHSITEALELLKEFTS